MIEESVGAFFSKIKKLVGNGDSEASLRGANTDHRCTFQIPTPEKPDEAAGTTQVE
jgi:hypothetical protein